MNYALYVLAIISGITVWVGSLALLDNSVLIVLLTVASMAFVIGVAIYYSPELTD